MSFWKEFLSNAVYMLTVSSLIMIMMLIFGYAALHLFAAAPNLSLQGLIWSIIASFVGAAIAISFIGTILSRMK